VPGTLYLVATPIGNLEDITLRALRVLRECDLIACEDTRQTRHLLDHFGISRPVVSYHEHNEAARAAEFVVKLQAGANIALVTDAGTPLISDPGYRAASAAIASGIQVVPVPGASAVLAALAASRQPWRGVLSGRMTRTPSLTSNDTLLSMPSCCNRALGSLMPLELPTRMISVCMACLPM